MAELGFDLMLVLVVSKDSSQEMQGALCLCREETSAEQTAWAATRGVHSAAIGPGCENHGVLSHCAKMVSNCIPEILQRLILYCEEGNVTQGTA